MLTFWNLNAPILIYTVMQSVLDNYIILLNREKTRKTPTPSKKFLTTKMTSPTPDGLRERTL